MHAHIRLVKTMSPTFLLQPRTRLHDRIRHIATALLLMTFAGTVNANTYHIGAAPGFPQSYDALLTHSAGGSFVDYFYFEVGPLQRLTHTAVSLNLRFSSGLDYHISGLNAGFYDLSNTFYGIANGIGDPQEAALEQTLLPGSYYAAVSGFADGSAGGKYTYSIAAIPEPEKWMLMAVGFAAVSFLAYRRR